MGSRITRSIYRTQRSAHPSQPDIIKAIKFFSVLLGLLLCFSIGYSHRIDRILLAKASPHYHPDQIFDTVQLVFQLVASVGIGLLLSLFNFTAFVFKCAAACMVSQLLLYGSFGRLGMGALYAGEILFDVNSIGVLMSILTMVKTRYQPQQQVLWTALALASLDIGLHWSRLITPLAHDNSSVQSIYILSTVFAVVATLAAFIIVVIQRGLRQKRGPQLDPRNWNMDSIKVMLKARISRFFAGWGWGVGVTAGLLWGVVQVGLEGFAIQHVYWNMLGWVGVVASYFVVAQFKQHYQWIFHLVVLGLFVGASFVASGELGSLLGIVILNYARVGNFLAINLKTNQAYYPIAIGFYFAANAIGNYIQVMLQTPSNLLLYGAVVTIVQFVLTYRSVKYESNRANMQQFEQQRMGLSQ